MSRIQDLANALECTVVDLFSAEYKELDENIRYIAEKLEGFTPETQKQLIDLMKSAIKIAEEKK